MSSSPDARTFAPVANARVGGRYRLERHGIGVGLGAHAAFDDEMHRPVDVHLERIGDERKRARFLRAALAASQVAHPNLVGVLDFGVDEALRVLFVVVERVAGRTLKDDVDAGGAMPWPRAVFVLRQLAAAVATAHSDGQFVAEVRATSVRLCNVEGIRDFVKVDITPARRPDPRRDIRAIGRIAWRLLVGTAPPLTGVRAPCIALRVDVPPALEAIVMASLDARATRRPSAVEVFASLRALMPGR